MDEVIEKDIEKVVKVVLILLKIVNVGIRFVKVIFVYFIELEIRNEG